MASESQVKEYLACWLQVGKRILHDSGNREFHDPRIVNKRGYTSEFESWWDEFRENAHHWHLEGCNNALDVLFTPQWDIVDCALCVMPVPKLVAGVNDPNCTCSDLELWPNLEIPKPHTPNDMQDKLTKLRKKLRILEDGGNSIHKCTNYDLERV